MKTLVLNTYATSLALFTTGNHQFWWEMRAFIVGKQIKIETDDSASAEERKGESSVPNESQAGSAQVKSTFETFVSYPNSRPPTLIWISFDGSDRVNITTNIIKLGTRIKVCPYLALNYVISESNVFYSLNASLTSERYFSRHSHRLSFPPLNAVGHVSTFRPWLLL